MSVLSDAKLREIYDSKGCHDAGLRAVADAAIAADRAARAEPVLKVRVGRESIELLKHKVGGRLALPIGDHFLYTAPPAAPVIPQCFMTAESGNGGYRLVMKFQSLVDLHKAHDAMIAMLAAAPAPVVPEGFADWLRREMPAGTVIGDPDWWARRIQPFLPATPVSEQIAEAVKAERERIYALLDSNPEHIWRDAGFMQWRAKRSQESE